MAGTVWHGLIKHGLALQARDVTPTSRRPSAHSIALAEVWNFIHLAARKAPAKSYSSKFRSLVWWQIYKHLVGKPYDIVLKDGIKLRCHPDSPSASLAIYEGLPEYDEMTFLLRYLRNTDVFIDIGANIGLYTLLAATRIGSGKIYSYEPVTKAFERLCENIAINDLSNVIPMRCAIGDHHAVVHLVSPARASEMSFIATTEGESGVSLEQAPMHSLDALVAQEQIDNKDVRQLALGKIDIEGSTYQALRGACDLLRQRLPPVWIIEINQLSLRYSVTPDDIRKLLASFGYELYRYDATARVLKPTDKLDGRHQNYLAIADIAMTMRRVHGEERRDNEAPPC